MDKREAVRIKQFYKKVNESICINYRLSAPRSDVKTIRKHLRTILHKKLEIKGHNSDKVVEMYAKGDKLIARITGMRLRVKLYSERKNRIKGNFDRVNKILSKAIALHDQFKMMDSNEVNALFAAATPVVEHVLMYRTVRPVDNCVPLDSLHVLGFVKINDPTINIDFGEDIVSRKLESAFLFTDDREKDNGKFGKIFVGVTRAYHVGLIFRFAYSTENLSKETPFIPVFKATRKIMNPLMIKFARDTHNKRVKIRI